VPHGAGAVTQTIMGNVRLFSSMQFGAVIPLPNIGPGLATIPTQFGSVRH